MSESPEPSDLAPGAVLVGRYRLGALIGRGSTNDVYAAQDLPLARRVALRIMRPEHVASPESLDARSQSLKREADVWQAVRQRPLAPGAEGAVEVVAFGFTDGAPRRPFLAVELLQGWNAQDLLDQSRAAGKPLPAKAVYELVKGLAHTLNLLHSMGVVHGALKPASAFVHRSGKGWVVKLCNLGILARPNRGETRYTSPEQCAGLPAEYASDTYLLSLLTYELLTSHWPWDAPPSLQQMSEALKRGTPPNAAIPLSRFMDSLPRRATDRD